MSLDVGRPKSTPRTTAAGRVNRAVTHRLKERYRVRRLASDRQAGTWAKEQIRKECYAFARRNWRFLAGLGVGAAVLILAAGFFITNHYVGGFAGGFIAAGAIAAMISLVVQLTGVGARTMGVTAERWTASELRKLTRAGWRVVNGAALQKWDIDHVLVGPGGVIAIETKWTSDWGSAYARGVLAGAIDTTRHNERNLRYWLPLESRSTAPINSAVFLWGGLGTGRAGEPGTPEIPVDVVHGPEAAADWRRTVLARPLVFDTDTIDRVWRVLAERVRQQEERREAAPLSLSALYWRAIELVLAAMAAIAVSIEVLNSSRSWLTWTIVMCSATLLGAGGTRIARFRLAALAWLTATLGSAALIGLFALLV